MHWESFFKKIKGGVNIRGRGLLSHVQHLDVIGSLCSNESSTFDKDTRDRLFTARFSVGTSKNAVPNPGSPQQGLSIVLISTP